ncbi:ATP-binding protein [Roseofilum sp. BLCC_M91]|uniref:ATP-binding protein n=1 Tax=Roseofilum halophilum BLCC-M91 TaxID=3022259 RepID=A0ABT7BSY0_9CYAN|nr:ATP-binding protein [Roseofilum halophilum]MDJ1181403.1 ATP-binding protein [Roseofilum halophilum BLCC-M91]
MPRLDKFLKAAGEPVDVDRRKPNSRPTTTQSEEQEEKDDYGQSKIDFSLYLREAKYTLSDVILPERTKKQVDLILAELEYQDLIFQEWGMAEKHKLDKALSVNFSGPPGTGKTLTAEAVAHALNLKLLDVPYEQIESKYVGETPKNIRGTFEFATENNAVLFFDEADSFLGKRLENVTQATDTAVNLTRSVMIKQLSAYEGIVIFATNLIRNYDPAFMSRIRWKVQFDLPTEEAREQIWQAQIPEKLPLDDSVDFSALAKEFEEISGRDIKNAVFQAVVAAAREDKPKEEKRVNQSHFREAIGEIIEANKAASQQTVTLTPVEGDVPLPQLPDSIEGSVQDSNETESGENER